MFIAGQILGFCAMICSIVSLQMRTHKKIMFMQVLTAAFFCIHYILIGGITAAALNGTAVVRNVIFYHNDKKIFSGKWITVLFSVVMALFGIISWQSWFSVFMVVGMVLNTISFSFHKPQNTRKLIIVSSPMLMIYNMFALSIGGSISEFLSTVSTIIAYIRYKRESKNKGL